MYPHPRRPESAKPTFTVPASWLADQGITEAERKLFRDIAAQRKAQVSGQMKLSAEEAEFVYRYAQFRHGSALTKQVEERKGAVVPHFPKLPLPDPSPPNAKPVASPRTVPKSVETQQRLPSARRTPRK
jgi:hypothetical protein